MEIWQKNIKKFREAIGINKAELARRAGLVPGSVTRYEEEEGKKYSYATLNKLAKGLKCSVEDFFNGEDEPIDLENIVKIKGYVPLISWVQAGAWMEICDTFHPGDAEEWMPVTKNVGDHAFALRINGTSMEPKFQIGDIIIVDPDSVVTSGDFIVAKLHNGNGENGDATFKRFVQEGTKTYLKPLNREEHEPIDMTGKEFCIVGRVVQRITEL